VAQNPPSSGTTPSSPNGGSPAVPVTPGGNGSVPPVPPAGGNPVVQNPPAPSVPGTTPPSQGGGVVPPGNDGGSIAQNPPVVPPTDGGSVPNASQDCGKDKDCSQLQVEMSRVCSARRSLIPFPNFVFFEEARRPILTFESDVSACVKAPNTRSLASIGGSLPHPVESQLISMILNPSGKSAGNRTKSVTIGKQDLARVDLMQGKYRTRIALALKQIKAWFPQSWYNLYVNARVCDDTNKDGLCEGEADSNQLLVQSTGFRLSRVPRQINLMVWNGRSRTLREDPRLCEMQISPLVLDLNGDGLKFSSAEDGVLFDLNATGTPVLSAWVTSQDDALLVRDINGNGVVDSGSELFGSATSLARGGRAANGFLALAELDSNANGYFDRRDAKWSEVQLWIDRDHDGYSASDEFISLERAGVSSIHLGYVDAAEVDPYGNETRQRSTFSRASRKGTLAYRQVIDIWFSTLKAE
jgi:hypothetical protein